jgi:hypothetical protein
MKEIIIHRRGCRCLGQSGYHGERHEWRCLPEATSLRESHIFSSLSIEQASFSTLFFPLLFQNGYPKWPLQGVARNVAGEAIGKMSSNEWSTDC